MFKEIRVERTGGKERASRVYHMWSSGRVRVSVMPSRSNTERERKERRGRVRRR